MYLIYDDSFAESVAENIVKATAADLLNSVRIFKSAPGLATPHASAHTRSR